MESFVLLARQDPHAGRRRIGRWTFGLAAASSAKRSIYLTDCATAEPERQVLLCGHEALFDQDWPENLRPSLRAQINRAQNKHLKVAIVMNPGIPLRAELDACRLSWLRGKGLLRFGYLTEPSARFAWSSTPLALVHRDTELVAFAPLLIGEGRPGVCTD